MKYLIEEFIKSNPKAKEKYEILMANQPNDLSGGIPKKRLGILFNEDAEPLEVGKLINRLVQAAGESNVFAFDVRKFKDDLAANMMLLVAASGMIAGILFLMTFF